MSFRAGFSPEESAVDFAFQDSSAGEEFVHANLALT